MGWRGYGDIDFIADPRDGLVKIMEVNPRLSAPVKICFAAGVDIADMLVKFSLGEEIPAVPGYQENIYSATRWPGSHVVFEVKGSIYRRSELVSVFWQKCPVSGHGRR
jgi:hypothetical protein